MFFCDYLTIQLLNEIFFVGMFVAVGFFFRINSFGIHPVVGRSNQISRDVMGSWGDFLCHSSVGEMSGNIETGWWFQHLWKILVCNPIYEMENNKCSKAPTSKIIPVNVRVNLSGVIFQAWRTWQTSWTPVTPVENHPDFHRKIYCMFMRM